MIVAIICSKKDVVGKNIYKLLIKKFGFKESNEFFDNNKVYFLKKDLVFFKLYLINSGLVFADFVNKIKSDLIVFASKHCSKSNIPALTVHAIGNFGKANLGGKENNLIPTNASIIKSFLINLKRLKEKEARLNDFIVSLECTHHGPFLTKPAVFIELGSSRKDWSNSIACELISKTIIETNYIKKFNVIAIAFGEIHYPHYFTRIILETNIAIGHILPKHQLNNLNSSILRQMIDCSNATFALIEWNSLKSDERNKLIELLNEIKFPWKKAKEVLK